jgi:hypothetical protein
MRIAQVAPLSEAVPPKLYGGTERVVSWLIEDLVAKGHEVTLLPPAVRKRLPISCPVLREGFAWLEFVTISPVTSSC